LYSEQNPIIVVVQAPKVNLRCSFLGAQGLEVKTNLIIL
jgi:hypothetical protein